jgi:glycine dehydrogenase
MEALVNFQTMVCDLTAMPIANASMLDEATAAAEAMTLAKRQVKGRSMRMVVDSDCHPQTIEVIQTRAQPLGIEVVLTNGPQAWQTALAAGDYFAALRAYPGSSGALVDASADADIIHSHQAALIVCADLLALTLLTPPGEMGADIVVGTTQRFGMPMGAGGPHAAYLACKDEYKRSMPGRLVGVSIDVHSQPAYRLALQTREQHIRREKATSNICTAQVLPAVVASMYAVYHGPQGLKRIAQRVSSYCAILAQGLQQMGCVMLHDTAFDTLGVVMASPQAASELQARAVAAGVNLRRLNDHTIGISLDETTTREDVQLLWQLLARPDCALPDWSRFEKGIAPLIPEGLRRSSDFLTHPVFSKYHSETGMLRYIRQLSDKDLALDRSMIPLGSCTMKLNATSEMIPITWPEFANVHPFAPADQLQGYAELDRQLRQWLCEATGYAGISLQPNAGSQGEYAGLLVIQAYHRAHGQGHRHICLIPSSAHGTNPASAQMVGMQVVVTQCDENGNVDMADLQAKCEQHSANLAAVMITYPSTHGVFETQVKALCALVHQHGGRVYVDGANMNALVGVAAPGEFGGDVSHLNLHKTFLHPARRRRPRRGTGVRGARPGALFAGPCHGGLARWRANRPNPGQRPRQTRRRTGGGRHLSGAFGQRRGVAHFLDVLPHDGRGRLATGHRDGHPVRQLHQPPFGRPLPHLVRGRARPRGARMHLGPAWPQRQCRCDGRGRGQAFDGPWLPCAHLVLPRGQHLDG